VAEAGVEALEADLEGLVVGEENLEALVDLEVLVDLEAGEVDLEGLVVGEEALEVLAGLVAGEALVAGAEVLVDLEGLVVGEEALEVLVGLVAGEALALWWLGQRMGWTRLEALIGLWN
jgi:xanthosine utilization system XapX-like protein